MLSPDLTNLLGNLDYNKLPVESVSYLQSYYLDKNKETTIKYSKVDPDLVLLPSESIDQIYDSSMKLKRIYKI